jgi:hypothetical protein
MHTISVDKPKLSVHLIHAHLRYASCWARGRSRQAVASIEKLASLRWMHRRRPRRLGPHRGGSRIVREVVRRMRPSRRTEEPT